MKTLPESNFAAFVYLFQLITLLIFQHHVFIGLQGNLIR